jgi:hypothetical protein
VGMTMPPYKARLGGQRWPRSGWRKRDGEADEVGMLIWSGWTTTRL